MKIKILFLLFFLLNVNVIFAAGPERVSTEYPFAVCYYEKEDVYFVSYIAGEPVKQNANGYISKFDKNLKRVKDRYFIKGLNAPRGMVILDDRLYVADINTVKVFDLKTKQKLKVIDFGPMGKSFITDVCTDGKFLYVCDMFAGRIIQIDISEENGMITLVEGADLDFPSSILYDKDHLVFTTFFEGFIMSLNLDDLVVKTLGQSGVKNINGIVLDDKNNFYFSGGVGDGALYKFSFDEKFDKLQDIGGMLGDVFLNKNAELVVPVLFRKNDFRKVKI